MVLNQHPNVVFLTVGSAVEFVLVLVLHTSKFLGQVEHQIYPRAITMEVVEIWEEQEWFAFVINDLYYFILCIYFYYQLIILGLVSFTRK
jgi:hypothetical protein